MALLIALTGAVRAELQVIAPPGTDRDMALVIVSLCAGGSVSPVVADAERYLLQRMALDAGWDSGALSQEGLLNIVLEAAVVDASGPLWMPPHSFIDASGPGQGSCLTPSLSLILHIS